MSVPIRNHDLDLAFDPESGVSVIVRFEPPVHVVTLAGELDLTTRSIVHEACSSPDLVNVVVDLSGLTFMDCAGYRALAAARSDLERRGGALVLSAAIGEPQRLLALIEQLDRMEHPSLGADPRTAAESGPASTRASIPTSAVTPNEEHA